MKEFDNYRKKEGDFEALAHFVDHAYAQSWQEIYHQNNYFTQEEFKVLDEIYNEMANSIKKMVPKGLKIKEYKKIKKLINDYLAI